MKFKGTKVYNNRPRLFRFGGGVYKTKNMSQRQLNNDSVRAILMPGEIVIPTKHANKVAKFLKKENIKLPNL